MSTEPDDTAKEPIKDKTPTNPFEVLVLLFWGTRWRLPIGIIAVLAVVTFSFWITVPDSIKEDLLGNRSAPNTQNTDQEPEEPISGKGVEITKIELLSVEKGTYPYSDENLYSLAIYGRDTVVEDRDQYTLIIFYRDLANVDQRHGWFAVNKLDRRGFAEPNALSLDEISPQGWTYHTSRLYIALDLVPRLAFRAVILPKDTLERLSRDISDDELGWGKNTLTFLTEQNDIKISDRFMFDGRR